MTLDEKLDNFYKSAINSATSQSIDIVKEYQDTLQSIYDERKNSALKKAETTYRMEADKILREKNRKLSHEAQNIKRRVLEKTEELSKLIFTDVKHMLSDFMNTTNYEQLLIQQIKTALDFAGNEEITVYLNSSDKHLKDSIESSSGIKLTISDRDFMGGIRAVIPSRSVLIDYSFLTKLEEEKNSFTL